MVRLFICAASFVGAFLISGCASVPMASKEADSALKQFAAPAPEKAGLYIYRDSAVGQALKKSVSLDGSLIGETANKVYFYKEIPPGNHVLSTESEFSDNSVTFAADAGKNYFAQQYLKMGVFVGGAGIKMVDEDVGKSEVLKCALAQPQTTSTANVSPPAPAVAMPDTAPTPLPAVASVPPAATVDAAPIPLPIPEAPSEPVAPSSPQPVAPIASLPAPIASLPTPVAQRPVESSGKYHCETLNHPLRTVCTVKAQ